MAYYWATWLVEALSKDPFVAKRIVEVPGWQGRGRPPSQFSFLPTGILDHHTACMIRVGHDPAQCLNGILAGNATAPGPVSQLLGTWTPPGVRWNGSNADPRVYVVAAGRSNHAGVGEYPWGAPSGNASAIGIEWCGPSEAFAWPDVVIELRERVDAAILRHNGWPVEHVTTHWEYARPIGRKIDPSGAYAGEPKLAWNAHWDPAVWRKRIAARLNTESITVEDNMEIMTPPRRAYDSRAVKPLVAGEERVIPLGVSAKAAAVNIVAVAPVGNGYMTVWGGGAKPGTSALNMTSGQTIANAIQVEVQNGSITVSSSVGCHVVVDLYGYWP